MRTDERLDKGDRDELLDRVQHDLWLAEHFEPLPEDEDLAEGETLLIFRGQFVRNPGRERLGRADRLARDAHDAATLSGDTRRAMSRENVEVIRRANDAWNRGDLAALETFYAPDVEWRDLQHAPDAPPAVRGIEAVKRIWSDWLDSFGELRADIEEYIDAGDWVICLVHWHGSGTASGASVDLHSADAFEVREGKIVRAVFAYKSRAEALEAVGLDE